jgi:hypothetical protein
MPPAPAKSPAAPPAGGASHWMHSPNEPWVGEFASNRHTCQPIVPVLSHTHCVMSPRVHGIPVNTPPVPAAVPAVPPVPGVPASGPGIAVVPASPLPALFDPSSAISPEPESKPFAHPKSAPPRRTRAAAPASVLICFVISYPTTVRPRARRDSTCDHEPAPGLNVAARAWSRQRANTCAALGRRSSAELEERRRGAMEAYAAAFALTTLGRPSRYSSPASANTIASTPA